MNKLTQERTSRSTNKRSFFVFEGHRPSESKYSEDVTHSLRARGRARGDLNEQESKRVTSLVCQLNQVKLLKPFNQQNLP